MKLSTRGRYAVMAMADLAGHARDDGPEALAEIARRQEISLSYLEQLFAKLRRAGLARPANETPIADIVLAVDEPLKATRCHDGSPNGCLAKSGRCITHDLWDALGAEIESFLASVTLEDVLAKRVRRRARREETTGSQAAA